MSQGHWGLAMVVFCRLIFSKTRSLIRWMSPYNLRNWRLWMTCWRPSKIYDLLWHNVCWCSGKCLCIIFFCNCETGTKKHERRRSCGIRRKTSATWWLRYVPFGMVLIEQENRLLAKTWKPNEWKFGVVLFAERKQEEEEAAGEGWEIEKEGIQVLGGLLFPCPRVWASHC